MKRTLLLCLLSAGPLGLAACKKEAPPPPKTEELVPAKAAEKAPDKFKARFTTTKGDFVIEAVRDWAPNGVDRFYNLVKLGYYTDVAFFRVIPNFMVQFGINGNPAVNAQWRTATIEDDPMGTQSNKKGFVTFAKGGPNSRTTQLFINFVDNQRLDALGFPPIGQVVEGMDVVDQIFKVGEGAPAGKGPAQNLVQMEGNTYLRKNFPDLDYIKSAKVE